MRRLPAVDDGPLIPELGSTGRSVGLDPNETDSESPFRVEGFANGSTSRQHNEPISGLVSLQELEHQPSKEGCLSVAGCAALFSRPRSGESHCQIGAGRSNRSFFPRCPSESRRPIRPLGAHQGCDDGISTGRRYRPAGRESLLEPRVVLSPARPIVRRASFRWKSTGTRQEQRSRADRIPHCFVALSTDQGLRVC